MALLPSSGKMRKKSHLPKRRFYIFYILHFYILQFLFVAGSRQQLEFIKSKILKSLYIRSYQFVS